MRSYWKLPFINHKYFKKCFLKKRIFKIKFKNSLVSQNFIDKKVTVNNGKYYKTINIVQGMIGFKFGEFLLVKTFPFFVHKGTKRKSKKKNK